MGWWGAFLFHEELTKWEAFRKTLTKEEDIAECDKTIEFLKKKNADNETKDKV